MVSFYTSVEQIGNDILYRGYEKGKPVTKRVKFSPTLYIKTNNEDEATHASLIGDNYLKPKQFETASQMREFIERYKDVHGFGMYGSNSLIAQFIRDKFPGKIEYDPALINLFQYDIEVNISGEPQCADSVEVNTILFGEKERITLGEMRRSHLLTMYKVEDEDGEFKPYAETKWSKHINAKYPDVDTADQEITAISIKSSKSERYTLLSLKGYDKKKTQSGIHPDLIDFFEFDDEKEMLRKFVRIWQNEYPEIITGWNVEFFDIQYTITRIIKLLGETTANSLSPWGKLKKITVEKFGRQQSSYKIYGMTVIDYMDAFKKFGYKYGPQESYKLDHIAHVVLGEKKLSYEEYGTLSKLWIFDPQLYNDYALKDTKLIQRMEEEAALIALIMTMAYQSGVNYSDTLGTVGIWESTLYRKLMLDNVVPNVKTGAGERANELVGGYVKPPRVGMSKWVVSFDLNSLYPHLMMQYNMGPDTIVHELRQPVSVDMVISGHYKNEELPGYSVCANGAVFRNDQVGVIPAIIDEYYSRRSHVKKEMLSLESNEQSIKAELEKRGLLEA